MIVRDEAEKLRRNLPEVLARVDEAVVVDTGSTDGTVAVLEGLGLRPLRFAWRDDYSAARNFALDSARGDWVLVLDADERLDAGGLDKLRSLADSAPAGVWAFLLDVRNYSTLCDDPSWRPLGPEDCARHGATGYIPAKVARLFRRRPEVRYRGRVHELVEPSIDAAGGRLRESGVLLHHHVAARDPAKARRYLLLLERKAAEEPGNPKAWWELGYQKLGLGRTTEGVAALRRAWELAPGNPQIARDLATALNAAGRPAEALSLLNGLADPSLDVARGVSLHDLGRLDEAAAAFRRVLEHDEHHPQARFGLATVAACSDSEAALAQLDRLRRTAPGFWRADLLAAQVLERLNRPDEAIARYLGLLEHGVADEAELRYRLARLHRKKGEKRAAADALAAAIRADPTHVRALTDLAGLYGNAGAVKEAIELLGRAANSDPHDPLVFLNLALAGMLLPEPQVQQAAACAAWSANLGEPVEPALRRRIEAHGGVVFPPFDWKPSGDKPSWLFIVEDARAASGGNRVIFELANRLWEDGAEVAIASYLFQGPEWFDLEVPVFRVPRDWDGRGLGSCGVVVATSFVHAARALEIARKAGAVPVHLAQGDEYLLGPAPEHRFREKLQAESDRSYGLPMVQAVVSLYLRRLLRERYGVEAAHIPIGVDTGRFHPRPRGEGPPELCLLASSALPLKGLEDAAAAWEVLKAEGWRLVRISPRPRALPEEGVRDLVCPATEELAEALARAEALISTSRREAFGLPPLEAMASGTPVVMTIPEGSAEYARAGENCLAYPAGEVDALVDAVRRLRADPELRRRLVDAGLETARGRTWDAAVEALKAAVEDWRRSRTGG